MAKHEMAPVIEALLFASDEPLTVAALQKAVEDLSPAQIRAVLEEIREDCGAADRGITLLEVAGGYLFVSKESTAPWVEKLMKGKRRIRLSRAALETVAVIAYKQPIGRIEIERIRGVDCGGVLATLLERDLIMIKGRDSGPGKPLLYGTTQEFLNYFGLSKLADLPRLDEISALAAARREWTDAERARFEKHGVEPVDLAAAGPEELALGAGAAEEGGASPPAEAAGGTVAADPAEDDTVAADPAVEDPVAADTAAADPAADEPGR